MNSVEILVIIGSAVVGAIGAYFLFRNKSATILADANQKSDDVIRDAKKEAEKIVKSSKAQVKELRYKQKNEFDQETRAKRKEVQRLEKKVLHKEENLDKKADLLSCKELDLIERERLLVTSEAGLVKRVSESESRIDESKVLLEKIANMTPDEAKTELKKAMLGDAKRESAEVVRKIERETRQTASDRAREIICTAIQRTSADFVSEIAVSVVSLPSEEMKGRIIGREGRNIRAIEQVTGVDIIIDDTPEAVVLSCFDPIRREKARVLLEKLLSDGRIHPARIEELAKKVDVEFEEVVREAGEQAAFDLGVNGLHVELVRLLGRLRYRTSGVNNLLRTSVEVANIAGIVASELGLNVKQAKRAGLLFAIGKAVSQEMEGAYTQIGSVLARKYGESDEIVHAIANHTSNDTRAAYLPVLIGVAKRLSNQRPGARKEVLETFVKRLADMEEIVRKVERVDNAFVVQAGREIRVMVESAKVTDDDALLVLRDIENGIKDSMVYPGQVNINLIKETRATSFAK